MIDKEILLKWLFNINNKLKRKITIIAIGGTAMTLLGLKSSTKDIDFCIKSEDKKDFKNNLDKEFKVDIYFDGYIFSEQLPDDYIKKAKKIVVMKNIVLKALSPVDIIITKTVNIRQDV